MAAQNDGGFAFPVPNDANTNGQEGMTLRDWFAGQALAVIDYLLEKNAQHKDSIHGLRSALNSVMGVQTLEPSEAAAEVFTQDYYRGDGVFVDAEI